MRELDASGQERTEADHPSRRGLGAMLSAPATVTGLLMFMVLVSVVLIGAGLR